MYFVGLTRLTHIPKPFLTELDCFLKKMYSSMQYFTPKTIARELQISEDLAWEFAFDVRDLGLIHTLKVVQCQTCQKIHRKEEIELCRSCGETKQLKKGVYFQVR